MVSTYLHPNIRVRLKSQFALRVGIASSVGTLRNAIETASRQAQDLTVARSPNLESRSQDLCGRQQNGKLLVSVQDIKTYPLTGG